MPAPTTVCSSSMNRMISPAELLHFLQDGLEALFEFAAKLGAGDQRAHIERHDALVLQPFGNVAAHDAQGQPFDDGGLAHARLADQHRVVLGAAREHLDDAANLLVAADHRVELALGGELGEIAAVFFERFVGGFGILRGDALAASDFLEGAHEALTRDTEFAEELAGRARVVSGGEQDVLDRDVVVLEALGFLLGLGQELGDAGGDVDLVGAAGGAGDFGQAVDFLLDAGAEGVDADVGLIEDGGGEATLLIEEG